MKGIALFDPAETARFYPQCAPCHYNRSLHTKGGYGIDMQPCASCPRSPHRTASGDQSRDESALSAGFMVKRYRKLKIQVNQGMLE